MHYTYENDFGGSWGWKGWGGFRARRGDMSPIILKVLAEKPMHGYEIIGRLEEMSHGFWRPSAGSVYPTLTMLEEQELVTSREENGKKIYELTEKGAKEAGEAEDTFQPHWERVRHYGHFKDVRPILGEAMGYLKQIARQDSDEKYDEVKKILGETRDKLRVLAERD
jgi:DNA-binding PadR family transcriptional regulator